MCIDSGEPSLATEKTMTFDSFIYDVDDNGSVITSLASIDQNSLESKVLCLWGENSSGKTHLLHVIRHSCRRARVKYITADQFCINLACGIADNKVREFEDSFNEVDILLLDDAQFLVGKYALEFLKEKIGPRIHQHVLLASDCDPYAIGILNENEIALRLESPSANIRQQIVRKISDKMQLQLNEATQQLIAKNISDIRRIHGFLTFLNATNEEKSMWP